MPATVESNVTHDLMRSIMQEQQKKIQSQKERIYYLEGELAHKDELLDGRRCECGKGRGED